MSDVVTAAAGILGQKVGGSFAGTAKIVIEGEGTIMLDSSGARVGDGEADVILTASAETFKGILDGSENATAAFMMGKLKVDGDMGLAIQLGGALS
jgi:putative sterol carrier protein